jgi:GcrA cell cycle regulator
MRILFDWTDKAEARLRKLWAEGYTAASIAGMIGAGSRNVVLGRVYKLGLTREKGKRKGNRIVPFEKPKPEPRAYLAKQDVHGERRGCYSARKGGVSAIPGSLPKPTPVRVEPVFPKITGLPDALLQRPAGQCGWPIGDTSQPDFHYCTAAKLPGADNPYCLQHAKVAAGAAAHTDEWYEQRRLWALKNPATPVGRAVNAHFGRHESV